MRLPEFARSTTFRGALVIAGAFGVCTFLLFAFVYWQTASYVTGNIDAFITADLQRVEGGTRRQVLDYIAERLNEDPRRVKLAGLFGADGRRIAGNVDTLPADLPMDGIARPSELVRVDNRGQELQNARAVAHRFGSGDTLVIGRDADELREVAEIVTRALALGALPAVILALLAGVWLSIRAQRRIDGMNLQVQRIIAGELRERLPAGTADPLGRLAGIVNMMLDELERLVGELADVGDDIAHDLRTPLTRVRAVLERGRDSAQTLEELRGVTDHAITGLDQSLSIITALLRIAEIDHGRRIAAVSQVGLSDIVRAVHDLYGPIAEDKGVSLIAQPDDTVSVAGDRDLLFEAVANLVDNAIKFTPTGGSVLVEVAQHLKGPVVRVRDTGPGISESDRQAVFRRFYRPDRSRHAPGVGLGLSLVAAIARLHGFRVAIGDGPGCTVELICC